MVDDSGDRSRRPHGLVQMSALKLRWCKERGSAVGSFVGASFEETIPGLGKILWNSRGVL